MLDLGLRAHDHAPAAGFVRLAHALITVDNTARRKIRRLDVTQQFGCLDLGIVDISAAGVDHFRKVMRRHIGRHTYRDTVGSVNQQIRHTGRQNHRFLFLAVVVIRKIHGFLSDIPNHLQGERGHSGLGITRSRCTVAIHGTEVTVTIHQRISGGENLCHLNHGIVDRTVTVRVIFTENLTYRIGTFSVRLA